MRCYLNCWSRGLILVAMTVALCGQDRKPIARVQAPPAYPYEMSRAGIGGRVVVQFVITRTGSTDEIAVVRSTDRRFDLTAIQAVRTWRFEPALKQGKPVACRVMQELELSLLSPPTYPAELLRQGSTGSAEIEFSINEQGRAIDVKTVNASGSEFAGAARAAVMASTYAPAFPGSKAGSTRQRAQYRFEPDGQGDARVDDNTRKFLARLKKNPEIVPFSNLDAPPTRKVNPEPSVAPDLMATIGTGTAQVAIFIDPSGNVILPQVVTATHEDLGYAAAQAIRDWKYTAPKKGGKSVIARGIVEMAFGTK
jgi:TonB family protein